MRNVFSHVPQRHQKRLARELVAVLHADSLDAAKRNLRSFRLRFEKQFPEGSRASNAASPTPPLRDKARYHVDMSAKPPTPTDPLQEAAAGRVALWLDVADLAWLSRQCSCADDAPDEVRDRCARIRFRANAALHKSGHRP
ncbi:MAG: hypothetical protein AB7T06_42190 [Kofleriaceae bacterium]